MTSVVETRVAARVHAEPAKRPWVFRMTWPRAYLLSFVAIGAFAITYRLLFGLGAATNLSDRWPWGIWVWWDVMTGVALAGGGYSMALLVNFLGREKWKPLERAAFLTSLIGYLLVVGGLFLDLGRWTNVWRVPLFWKGNPHSVMFELVWCVSGYTFVQIVEFGHIFVERVKMPRLAALLHKIYAPVLVVGVILPFLHQSALGSLYVIAKGRLDPLWWSMLLPVFFLMSSFFIGPAMVTAEGFLSARFRGHKPPIKLLGPMVQLSGVMMLVYFGLKVFDITSRGQVGHLLDGSIQSLLFLTETVLGILLPAFFFLNPRTRRLPKYLATGATMAVVGLALNRGDVVFAGMAASARGATYLPSLMELAITVGLVAAGILVYAFVVDNFPIIPEGDSETPASAKAVTRSRPYTVFVPKPRIRSEEPPPPES